MLSHLRAVRSWRRTGRGIHVKANDQQLMHTCTSRWGKEDKLHRPGNWMNQNPLVFKSYASQVFQLNAMERDRHDPQQRPSGIKAPSRPDVLLDQLLSELQLLSLLSLVATHRSRLTR